MVLALLVLLATCANLASIFAARAPQNEVVNWQFVWRLVQAAGTSCANFSSKQFSDRKQRLQQRCQ